MSKPKTIPERGVYVIQVGDPGKETTFTVFFVKTYAEPIGRFQNITVCGLRVGNDMKTYWGNTIQNPHDSGNNRKGRQWSFRRAFLQFAQEKGALVVGDCLDPKGAKNGTVLNQTKAAQKLFDVLRQKLFELEAW